MRITFLGVGEACDPKHGNTSILLEIPGQFSLLIDCGFSVPHRYFSHCDSADSPDAVWISHFHGDHFLGLPLLLLRLWEMGRTQPLLLIGQEEMEEKWKEAMELAYPGFTAKLSFPVRSLTAAAGQPLAVGPLTLTPARTIHSQPNLGLLIDDGLHRFYYSGDGRPTPESARLTADCDLAVHEAFTLEDSVSNHGSVQSCLALARTQRIKRLALVHLERHTRRREELTALLAAEERAFLAREDLVISLGRSLDKAGLARL